MPPPPNESGESAASAGLDPDLGRTVLGRYRIVRRLARGGMGVVYLARQEGAGGFARPVVIKRVADEHDGRAETRGMFIREGRVLSRLSHPNIVSVVELAEDDDQLLLVLEYVAGQHLGRWLRFTRLAGDHVPVALAVTIVEQVLRGLDHAHHAPQPNGSTACVIHRDVSPSNVLLRPDGVVKLVDFGIARDQENSDGFRTQDTGTVKGKFPYMAPELFRGVAASARSDIYACGVVLHEVLAGRNELRGAALEETLSNVMRRALSPLADSRSDVPAALDAIVSRATSKRPSARYARASEMADELAALVTGDEPREGLAARLREDLPRLASALDVPSLEELDAAWRAPPPAVEEAAPDASGEPPAPSPTSTAPDRWGALWTGVAALAVVGAAAVVGWVAIDSRGDDAPTVTVSAETVLTTDPPEAAEPREPTDAPGDTGSAAPADESARGTVATRTEARQAEARPESGPPPSVNRVYAERVRARLPALQRCAAEADAGTTVALEFRVTAPGRAEQVTVIGDGVPPELAGCVERVARRITFPAPPAPLTFRVPVRIERVGGG